MKSLEKRYLPAYNNIPSFRRDIIDTQFSSFYELEERKRKKRENLPKSITNAIMGAVIGQFLTDLYFSIFFNEDTLLERDLRVSSIALYYASVASGIIIGICGQYMDKFAIIIIATTFFAFVNNLMDSLINETEFEIPNTELVESIIATIILIYIFSPRARNDYINHYYERHCIKKKPLDTKSTFLSALILNAVTNTYFGTINKIKSERASTPTTPAAIADPDDIIM